MPFVEIIHVYFDNHMKHINTLWAICLFYVKVGGTYNHYHNSYTHTEH
jgi:hypothetical protein